MVLLFDCFCRSLIRVLLYFSCANQLVSERTSEKNSTFDPPLYMVHKMAGGGGLAQQVAEKLADLIQVSF